MMYSKLYTVLLGILLDWSGIAALECFNCLNVNGEEACNKTIVCNNDQSCYKDTIASGLTKTVSLGCINNKQCSFDASSASSLVGRDIRKRQGDRCHECCSTDRCNEILCVHRNRWPEGQPNSIYHFSIAHNTKFTPETDNSKTVLCIDEETVDCPRLESMFGICRDIHHAKSVCPKFCGLCDVVDGAWTEWSTWSTCDVTCENGTQSRSRTCTNPAPAHGGLDCVGNKDESNQCQNQPCPVDGDWSEWTSWGTCSATCDVGIQRRQRTCANPTPAHFGHNCFGVNFDVRLCMPKACANGGWSSWGVWGSCSVTCGDGFRSRTRNCTNPKPSLSGRYCSGESSQVGNCSNNVCGGHYAVSFLATLTHPVTGCLTGEKIIFDNIKINQGSAYNRTNGTFTAPRNGTYQIGVTLSASPHHGFSVQIAKNLDSLSDKGYGYLFLEGGSHWEHRMTSNMIQLNAGDRIWISCLGNSTVYGHNDGNTHDYNSHFSGFLIGSN